MRRKYRHVVRILNRATLSEIDVFEAYLREIYEDFRKEWKDDVMIRKSEIDENGDILPVVYVRVPEEGVEIHYQYMGEEYDRDKQETEEDEPDEPPIHTWHSRFTIKDFKRFAKQAQQINVSFYEL